MARQADQFGLALQAVRHALRLTQDVLGARLGVSRTTLTRWEIRNELPPIGQRKHLATSFPDAPSELRAALVRTLELDEQFVASLGPPRPAPSPPAPPTLPPGALDGAFLELCESVDVPPARLRAGLAEFLRRAEATGVTLEGTRAQLQPAPKAARKTPTR
ncbi:MAG TPA: helix-turn-helix transcriptional regulator [Polyangiaceae bacterium]|jgi:transcriptional regulator with XRE-family HTH domain